MPRKNKGNNSLSFEDQTPKSSRNNEEISMGDVLNAIQELSRSVEEIRTGTLANQNDITSLRQQVSNIILEPPDEVDNEENNAIESEEISKADIVLMPNEGLKLYDLPKFSGCAEEWPLFYASFQDTTSAFKYTNRHNLMRLQKCLVGEAKETVKAMLIYPNIVPEVMEELEFRFGRPDLLVRAQLNKVQQFPNISEGKLENLIAFSTMVRNMVTFLSSAKCDHHLSNTTLLEQLICKLPPSKQFDWARYASTLKRYPTMKEFSAWLGELAKIICLVPQMPVSTKNIQVKNAPLASTQNSSRRVMYAQEDESRQPEKCLQCSGMHFIANCETFVNKMNCQQRWAKVKKLRLCFSCLCMGHNTFQCSSKRCCGINGCRKNHHNLLHESDQPPPRTDYQPPPKSDQQLQSKPVLSCTKPCSGYLFKLVPILITGPYGHIEVFALIDEGSSVSMLDVNIANQLGLKGKKQSLTLQWYDEEIVTQDSTILNVNIRSQSGEHFEIKNVHAVNSLCLPVQSFQKSQFKHFEMLPLKDYANIRPSMLLGLHCANITASSALVSAGSSDPVAILTKLGWVAYGPTCSESVNNLSTLLICQKPSFKSLENAVSEFFATEHFGIENPMKPLESKDDIRAREILNNTIGYIGDRFEVGLLWKKYPPEFPSSFDMAVKRLKGIEAKMKNNIRFSEKYAAEINKYIEKGYARKLTLEEITNTTNPVWYLPHFAVQSLHKPEKLRIVFDAAAAVFQQSLNSALLKGPEQAKPLLGILFKFRQRRIAVAADIREMFSQVKICQADQDAQRFLWRNGDENKTIEQYVMTSMIFGAVCSPCCAEFIKNLNAENFRSQYPEAAAAIINNFYVDDFVCSFQDEYKALQICQQVVQINAKAGFELRNFSSNSPIIRNAMNENKSTDAVVLHRIAEILNSSEECQWKWVPTEINPADAATRIKKLPRIDSESLWLKGPKFLRLPEDDWPSAPFSFHTETPEEEIKPTHLLHCKASEVLICFNRFSSFFRLKRTIAWFLRALKLFKTKKGPPPKEICANLALMPPLLPSEINEAEKLIVKLVQSESFAAEKGLLSRQQPVTKKSKLYKLTPYLDEDGIIRASGRLDEALYLPYDVRRPMIMPKRHYVSNLTMMHYHVACHHQNNAIIINETRQKFWIIGAKPLLKFIQRSCMKCRIENAKPTPPLMGQLPTDRITPFVRAFSYTGVDLFGPLQVTVGQRREKRWAVLFTCLTVRAVHIEIVENLSTDAFLVCFRNFINRRGTPVRIRSDNGTNFIGAQKELRASEKELNVDQVRDEVTQLGIEWIFNCPQNPSAGGCWERLIRIVKRLLYKTIQNEAPRVETLRAALIEAENIINSRPLTDVPLMHSEEEPLTPNHFLIGCANKTQTRYNDVMPLCLRKQWHILQDLNNRLWKQWTTEFLPQLLRRPKWCDKITPLKVGDIVIVCDASLPRGQWLKGRIAEVYPSKTGEVRSAKVKTKNGFLTRPATKLAACMIGESGQDSREGGMLHK